MAGKVEIVLSSGISFNLITWRLIETKTNEYQVIAADLPSNRKYHVFFVAKRNNPFNYMTIIDQVRHQNLTWTDYILTQGDDTYLFIKVVSYNKMAIDRVLDKFVKNTDEDVQWIKNELLISVNPHDVYYQDLASFMKN